MPTVTLAVGDTTLTDANAVANGFSVTSSGYVIAAGNIVEFPVGSTATLFSAKSIIVLGTFKARPNAIAVKHKVKFTGIVENSFSDGGGTFSATNLPPGSDVGLWVLGAGVLDFVGTTKTAWGYVTNGTLAKGATTCTVSSSETAAVTPVSWVAGDEIVLCPTELPSVIDAGTNGDAGFFSHFDVRPIGSIATNTVTFGNKLGTSAPGLDYPHSPVTIPAATPRTMKAEVLNLTRNVMIEGTGPTQRTHVFVQSSAVQTIKYVTARYLGPRKTNVNAAGVGVKGRYGFHFHHCDDIAGTVVEGLVVRDAGFYGFVPHSSHGITWSKCVGYDIMNHAMWWDIPESATALHRTNDNIFEDSIVALVRDDPTTTANVASSNSAWFLASNGSSNILRRCRAVGMQGKGKTTSGIHWPEYQGPDGTGQAATEGVPWVVEDCVVHNNRTAGHFLWQQSDATGTSTRDVVYHCGGNGIQFGAYGNSTQFIDTMIHYCKGSGLMVNAIPGANGLGRISGTAADKVFINCPTAVYGILVTDHVNSGTGFFLVHNADLRKGTKACVGVKKGGHAGPARVKFTSTKFTGLPFYLDSNIIVSSLLETASATGTVTGAIQLRRYDQPGTYKSTEWNASVTDIPG